MNRQQVAEAYIPENFQSGINLFGKTYKITNVIEAIVLGVGGFCLIFFPLKMLGIAVESAIAFGLCLGGGLAYFGISGINNEPLHTFLKNVLLFYKSKRTTYYNKKPKKNAKHISLEGEEIKTELLPAEQLALLYEKYKKKALQNSREKMLEQEQTHEGDGIEYIFDDDEEFLEELESKKKGKK